SLSKGISFLVYALVGTPSVHRYPLVFNLGYTQNSPDSKYLHYTNGWTGRIFQCGEGWHSNEHAVRLWIPSPRVPQETDARCYAFTTPDATLIPRCNVC